LLGTKGYVVVVVVVVGVVVCRASKVCQIICSYLLITVMYVDSKKLLETGVLKLQLLF
jgi:hypothetical protein